MQMTLKRQQYKSDYQEKKVSVLLFVRCPISGVDDHRFDHFHHNDGLAKQTLKVLSSIEHHMKFPNL